MHALWTAAFGRLLIVSIVAAAPPMDQSPSALPLSASELEPESVLSSSESYVRPQTAQELADTAQTLGAAGFSSQAKQLLLEAQQVWLQEQQAKATQPADTDGQPVNREQIVTHLLQQGQHRLADDILRQWRREQPDDVTATILQAASYFAQGQPELALREFRGMRNDPPTELRGVVQMFTLLIQMQMNGVVPGVEANPWNVQFVGESGEYQAGSIRESEKQKLPEGVLNDMARLVSLLPTQGHYWGLYGELLNANGNTVAALKAFRLAKGLQYFPRPLRDRFRILEEHNLQLERQIQEQLAKASSAEQPTADGAEQKGDNGPTVTQLGSRTQIVVVAVIGGLLVLVLIVLQVREWRKAGRAKPKM